ncbi:MAG: oligosaccharide flippase family protein [Peptostreptococcaceae bacterium]|nr:oligosaccharide flippase family protein [Peptostreptococcaceae bacterium]
MIKIIKKKYNTMSLPIKAAIWFTISSFLLKSVSFITAPIFTRIIPPAQYGLLSVFLSYQQLFIIFATWEVQQGAYQKGLFTFNGNIRHFTSSTQSLANILTICFFLIVFFFEDFFYTITGMSRSILICLFFYSLVSPAYNLWVIRKRTVYAYKPALAVSWLYSISTIIISMIALLVIEKTANIKLASTLITASILGIIFFLPNANYTKLFINWKETKKHWIFLISFQGPLVFHSLSYLVLSQADRIMIGKMVGTSQVAFYSVAYNLAIVISLFQNSINMSLTPWRYQMLEEKKYEKIKNTTWNLLLAVAIIIFAFVLVAPEVMRLMFTEDYYEAIWCIPPISVSVYYLFLYSIFVNIETYFDKTKYIMYVSVVCAVLNIVLNYYGIMLFGYIASAYTTLISYILFAIGHFYFMSKICKNKILVDSILNRQAILIVSISFTLLSISVTFLYSYPVIRYGIIILIIASLFILYVRNPKILHNILKFSKLNDESREK